MTRPALNAQLPYRPPPRRTPKPKGPKAIGTLTNPFRRSDGVDTVKIAFRASVECAAQLEQLAASLKMLGIARNEWLEGLILYGIEHGYRPGQSEMGKDPKRKEAG